MPENSTFVGVLPPSETLKLHILLERNEAGRIVASVPELSNCQVEAPTQEQAVTALRQLLVLRLERLEIIPLEVRLSPGVPLENPWMKFAGVFKDDTDFAAIADALRAERETGE